MDSDREFDPQPNESTCSLIADEQGTIEASTIVDSTPQNTDKSGSRSLSPARLSANAADPEKGPVPKEKQQQQQQQSASNDSSGDSSTPDDGHERDPNIVDWDGPDDPLHPHNWPFRKRLILVSSISLITFLTPLGSSMFAPAVGPMMQEFSSTSKELAAFVVSVYLLGFAFGPLIIAPLSELYGRMYLYHTCNVLFVVFNIACAVANSMESLIVFRFLAGSAGSAPLSIGAGSLADMIRQERRGAAMSAWAMGPLLGPVIGPVAGGYIAEGLGWRWTFWILAIMSGAVTLNTLIFLRESYHPILLERKTQQKIKETGNVNLRSALASNKTPGRLFWVSIIRPTKMLLFSPIVLLLSVYAAVVYGYLYLLFTTISNVFMSQYGFSQGNVGLAFLGIGLGSIIGLAFLAYAMDRTLKVLAEKHGGEMKPEYRLPPMFLGGACIPIGLFWYGWSAHANLHYMMPIVGTLFVGVGMICIFMSASNYLVDAYTLHAASAMAANTVLRSVFGAVLPLAGEPMYDALGLGWGNSLLAFIALAMVPCPILFYKYGERIRKSKRFAVEF